MDPEIRTREKLGRLVSAWPGRLLIAFAAVTIALAVLDR
jgi:hypothetical protein